MVLSVLKPFSFLSSVCPLYKIAGGIKKKDITKLLDDKHAFLTCGV